MLIGITKKAHTLIDLKYRKTFTCHSWSVELEADRVTTLFRDGQIS